jgi:hypothetical protein
MVMMKHCLLITSCLLVIACQAMDSKEMLQRIEEKDLPDMIGKYIMYESLSKQMEKGILDKPMAVNTSFYIVFTEVSPGNKKGTVCLKDKIFYANDSDKK